MEKMYALVRPQARRWSAGPIHERIATMASRPAALGRVSFVGLLLGSGPRFARDALGPVLAFYIVWKLAGLAAGILAATLLALVAFWWERRRGASGILPAVGLGVALVQALAGIVSGSAGAYFAPAVIANGLYGVAFLGSVAIGRPLAGILAEETFPFPPRVKESAAFRQIFTWVSLMWGGYMIARSVLRLLVLAWSSVELFIVVSVLTGIPLTLGLMSWSFWYPLRVFRRNPELWRPDPGEQAPSRPAP
jgi:intracellular septation protein A